MELLLQPRVVSSKKRFRGHCLLHLVPQFDELALCVKKQSALFNISTQKRVRLTLVVGSTKVLESH